MFEVPTAIQVFSNCTCVEQSARDLGAKRARKWWRPPPSKDITAPLVTSQLEDGAVTSPPPQQSSADEVVDDSPLTGAVEGFCPSDCDKVFYIVGTVNGAEKYAF